MIFVFFTRKLGNGHIVTFRHVRFSGMRFLKKFPSIAQGPGPGPGPAGLTRGPGPGPGPAFTHSCILLLGFHQMTRVSSDIIHLSDI